MESPPSGGPCLVVGYDGSEAALAAVTYAAERAGRTGHVFVVHAVGPLANWLGASGEIPVTEADEGRGRAVLDGLLLQAGNALLDCNFEVELVPGGAAEAIVRVAAAREADEIVLGSRGQGRLGSLLGSVSEKVLQRADRPVVVIPHSAVRERSGAHS